MSVTSGCRSASLAAPRIRRQMRLAIIAMPSNVSTNADLAGVPAVTTDAGTRVAQFAAVAVPGRLH